MNARLVGAFALAVAIGLLIGIGVASALFVLWLARSVVM